MEILKHGHTVEVLGPNSLRKKVGAELKQAAGKYNS
jgi:predicted DNA-binding transcriptional regulator YafY